LESDPSLNIDEYLNVGGRPVKCAQRNNAFRRDDALASVSVRFRFVPATGYSESVSTGPPTLPQEGSLLAGRYLLGRVLGKGAMGVVYDAQQTRLESRVAIKVLRPEILGEPGLVARFEREARIIARLNSRHIVRVIDVDATEAGLPFLVMEFLDG